jgi:hypothetical protein
MKTTTQNGATLPATHGSASLADMTKDERSLLLYLETRAVDRGGLVQTPQMNADDFAILETWKASGFVEFGRLTRASIEKLRGSTHWVRLSEEAWKLAHEERRARCERLYTSKTWETTDEKRLGQNAQGHRSSERGETGASAAGVTRGEWFDASAGSVSIPSF